MRLPSCISSLGEATRFLVKILTSFRLRCCFMEVRMYLPMCYRWESWHDAATLGKQKVAS